MRDGWTVRPLEEVAHACLGKMLDKNKNRGESKPYLRNLNVRWFAFDLSDMLQMRFEDDERERYTAKKGDVLICEGGYPGRAAIWPYDEPVHFQKAIHRVRFHEPERAKWFLYYLHFCDINGSLRNHFTGAGIQHFTGEALKLFRVPLPPLPEQQRIVTILDEAFAGLATATANAEKNLKNTRELFDSYINSVFQKRESWPRVRLGDVAEKITKGSSPKWQGISYVDVPGVLFVTSENVGANRLIMNERKFVEERFNQKDKKSILKKGDVLTNIVGASIGRTAIYNLDDLANINQAVCLIRCKEKTINNQYLCYLLNSYALRQFLHDNETNNARANLSLGFFTDLEIPLPEMSKQMELIRQFDDMNDFVAKLEETYAQKLSYFAELRQSILQKAFSGELTSPPSQAIKEAAE